MRAHSMPQQLLHVFVSTMLNAICYSAVCVNNYSALLFAYRISCFEFTLTYIVCFLFPPILNAVCLRDLNDHGNAYLAFERAVTLAGAVKNPLVHLNFAIYCWHLKRYDLAQANLNNFHSVSSQVSVKNEVSATQLDMSNLVFYSNSEYQLYIGYLRSFINENLTQYYLSHIRAWYFTQSLHYLECVV